MTIKTFFLIGGAVAVGYGIAFLLVPQMVFAMYGFKGDAAVTLGYRYFGVALLGLGLLCWAIRDGSDRAMMRNALLAVAIGDIAGVIVSAWGTLGGSLNALGWFNVLLYAALAAGALYLYADAPVASRAAA